MRTLTSDSLYNRNALWNDRLLSDPQSVSLVRRRWQLLKAQIPDVIGCFDRWRAEMEPSALADGCMWATLDPARFDTFVTFRSSCDNLRKTFLTLVRRMDTLLSTL